MELKHMWGFRLLWLPHNRHHILVFSMSDPEWESSGQPTGHKLLFFFFVDPVSETRAGGAMYCERWQTCDCALRYRAASGTPWPGRGNDVGFAFMILISSGQMRNSCHTNTIHLAGYWRQPLRWLAVIPACWWWCPSPECRLGLLTCLLNRIWQKWWRNTSEIML